MRNQGRAVYPIGRCVTKMPGERADVVVFGLDLQMDYGFVMGAPVAKFDNVVQSLINLLAVYGCRLTEYRTQTSPPQRKVFVGRVVVGRTQKR